MTDTPLLRWRRFVLDDSSGHFEELALLRSCLYAHLGTSARDRFEVKTLASAEAATRSMERRVQALLRKRYLEDDAVERSAPVLRDHAAEKQQLFDEARLKVAAALPSFIAAWRASGYDPRLSFHRQAVVATGHQAPSHIAQACVALVSRLVGVAFVGQSREYDAEHGQRWSVPQRLSAEHYHSPARVLALARCKLRGQALRTDDLAAPGLDDEQQLELERLCGV
jgi:hypothetical protein